MNPRVLFAVLVGSAALAACQANPDATDVRQGSAVAPAPTPAPTPSSVPGQESKVETDGRAKSLASSFEIDLRAITNEASPKIQWAAVAGFKDFLVKLSASSDCEASFAFYRLSDTQTMLEHLVDGAYHVCVYGVAADGTLLPAKNNALRFVIDRKAPTVSAAASAVEGLSATLTATTSDGSTVSVAWASVAGLTFSEAAKHETRVTAAAAGSYSVEVVATDAAGNEARATVPLSFTTPVTTTPVPTHAPASLAFLDTDTDGGKVAGDVTIAKATDESDVSHYVLYWGTSATAKANGAAIATLATTGAAVVHTFADGTALPVDVTHLLAFSKNAGGEMALGASLAIVDKGVPVNAAASLGFTDTDLDGGELAGDITIVKATDEIDVSHYALYWGTSSTTKLSPTAMATLAKTGAGLTHTLPAPTAKPSGATHILVRTQNADGEMASGPAVLIADKGVPVNAASAVAFADTDLDGGELAGDVTITKAGSEADVTHYALYWGTNATTKLSGTPFATLAKTGADLVHAIAADTPAPAATHVLVFTRNADGEMASGAATLLVDKGVPENPPAGVAFTDTDLDGGQVAGTVTITKAGNEADVTHYVLYWGSDGTTKQAATPLATVAVTGADVTTSIGANTAIPTSPAATHLLAFSKNADGEMTSGVSVALTDKGVPENGATGIAFTDADLDAGEIQGALTMTRAADESDLTSYVLYWGSDATTKASATPIATIAKTATSIEHVFASGSTVLAGATHFLAYTANADGEIGTPFAAAIGDKVKQVFSHTAANQTLTVPAGVTSITVKAWGAGGGYSSHQGETGGAGAFVTAALTVIPGEALTVVVGGGGQSGNRGSAGGGRSALVRSGADIVTASGGGGAGCIYSGGAGGISQGQDGEHATYGGKGASTTAGGAGGLGDGPGAPGSGAGNGAVGAAYAGGEGSQSVGAGPAATFGGGGRGGECTGGGGGGLFGGGGGARQAHQDGGGGGGSSLVPAGGSGTAGNWFTPGATGDADYTGSTGYGGRSGFNSGYGYHGRIVVEW